MTATQELFQSLRSAFATEADPVWIAGLVLALLLAVVGVLLARANTRAKARRLLREQTLQLGRERGLSPADVEFATALAERSRISPLDVFKHLAAFERATARELGLRAPGSHTVREATAKRIAALRSALGFDVLAPDHWLSTTRELQAGDILQAGSTRFEVTEVTEAAFTLGLPAGAATVVGSGKLSLEVIRAHDARYAVQCRMVESFEVEGQRRVILAHDEDPQRLQQREFVRVRVARPMTFVSLEEDSAREQPATGQMVDLSAGGMSFDGPRKLPRGKLLLCSFEPADGVTFKDVAAIVLAAGALRGGAGFHVRVAFTRLSTAERDRLAAAVARVEQQEAARAALP